MYFYVAMIDKCNFFFVTLSMTLNTSNAAPLEFDRVWMNGAAFPKLNTAVMTLARNLKDNEK